MKTLYATFFLIVLVSARSLGQLTTTTTPGATALTSYFQGVGLTISNMTVTGAPGSVALFSGSSPMAFGSGIMMSTGIINSSINNPASTVLSTDNARTGDLTLDALSGGSTFDACIIEFDCTPANSNLLFNFAFASEEYNEFVGSTYSDVFAITVSGPNPSGGNYAQKNFAFIPNTTVPVVSVNSINNGSSATGPCMNCAYYIDNGSGTTNAYDGFTSGLQGFVPVTAGQNYHFKIAIADVDDRIYDSNLMFLANSFKSVSNPTGIAEQETENRIAVYPNPLSGSSLTIDSKDLISSLELYSYSGQQMQLAGFDRTTKTLLLTNISKGIYFLHITTENGRNVRKIMIE